MTASGPFGETTARSLGEHLHARRRDPVDLAEQALAAIAACDDRAIFTDVLADRALAEAKAARTRLKAGQPLSPLDGVPVAWKDLFDIAGRVTTAGSVVLKSNPPAQQDAALVAAGRRAGLVCVGCTNMTELAYSGIGLNPHYGTPRNPHGVGAARIPGGSSSGAAVAVARGLVPIAMGTDTGGSIRIPAAFNGIAGYKSSTGHYPMGGVLPLSPTLDSLGPLARTLEDCALVDTVLRGGTTLPTPAAVDSLHLLVPTNVVFDRMEPAVRNNFEAALDRLTKAGAKVTRQPLPAFDEIVETLAKRGHIVGSEALHLHWDLLHGPDAARMDPMVVRRLLQAKAMSAVDLLTVLALRKRLIGEVAATIGEAFVCYPTVPMVALEVAPLQASSDAFLAANVLTLRNSMLGNFLNWCGLALPTGTDAAGLPTSLMLSAVHGRDDALLSAGLAAERLVTPSSGAGS